MSTAALDTMQTDAPELGSVGKYYRSKISELREVSDGEAEGESAFAAANV